MTKDEPINKDAAFLTVSKAADFAKMHFTGMTHRDGFPAFLHSERVAAMLTEPQDIVVAYLHDLCEDTPVTQQMIYQEFGANVSKAVFLLTRTKAMPWNIYTRRIMMEVIDPFDTDIHQCAARVKIADMEDNLLRMDEKMASSSRDGEMYRETIKKMRKFLALPYNAK